MEREACVCDHGFERSDLCAEIINNNNNNNVGHSTRQGISLLKVSGRITHDIQPHTSQQLHSVQ